jgi:hypothetical protein
VLVQSLPAVHASPSAHVGQSAPPQSTSLSKPSLSKLVQLGARQVPPWQAPDVQSPWRKQCWPSPQGEQAPPQSASLSVPFCTVSVHDGSAQRLATHDPVRQSVAAEQIAPMGHGGHSAPPQSMSVSPMSWLRLLHAAEGQAPATQATPLGQAVPVTHSHAAQLPPQSTPVSLPF